MNQVASAAMPLLLLLILAQCRPATEPRPARDAGAFAFLADGDTTVVDEYVRTPSELNGTLRLFSREPGGATARAEYHVRYAAGRADSAHLSIRQVSPAGIVAGEAREWSVTFNRNGRGVEVEHGDGRRFESAAGEGVLPLFGPSIAMLESAFLQARQTSSDRVPLFHLAAAGRVDTATIRWLSPDSARLTIAGVSGSYQVDDAGRILGGTSSTEDLRTVRLR